VANAVRDVSNVWRISQLLRRVNWPRLRLLFLGQRQHGCPLAKPGTDLINQVGEQLLLYTPP
jgi:hypothetical protein